MEIKATCKFDFESVKALSHLSMFKKADPKKRMTFWLIVYAVLAAIVITQIIFWGPESKLLFELGGVVFIVLIECYLYFLLPRIKHRSLARLKEAENMYIFCDDEVKIFTKSAEYNAEAKVEYTLFVRCYETSKYFFLYQTNNQVLIIKKSTIVGGTAEDIRAKLSDFIGKKYIICRY